MKRKERRHLFKQILALVLAFAMSVPSVTYAAGEPEKKISDLIIEEDTEEKDIALEYVGTSQLSKARSVEENGEAATPNNLVAEMDTYYYVRSYIVWVSEEGVVHTYRDGETLTWSSDVKSISCSGTHIIQLHTNGTISTLGFGSNSHASDLLDALEETPIGKIVYAYAGYDFTYLINDKGELYGFGENGDAELGQGHTNKVTGLVKMMDNVYKATSSHGAAYPCYYIITKGGALYSWGDYKTSGPGNIGTNYVPVLVDTEHGITKDVESGYTGSIAINNAGYMSAWGYSFAGNFDTDVYETELFGSDVAFDDDTLGVMYYVLGGDLYTVDCGFGMGEPVLRDTDVQTVIYGYCGTCLYQKTDGSIYQLTNGDFEINPLNITANLAKVNPSFTTVEVTHHANDYYALQVIDATTGEPMADTVVQINGAGYNTDEFGLYELKDSSSKTKNVNIIIEKEGYLKKELKDYTLYKDECAVLEITALKDAVVYEGSLFHHTGEIDTFDINGSNQSMEKLGHDIVNEEHVFDVRETDRDLISIRFKTGLQNVEKIELLQKGEVIQEIDENGLTADQFIAGEGVGYFLNIPIKKLENNVGLYIRFTLKDQKEEKIAKFKIKVIDIAAMDNAELDIDFKDGKMSIKLPSDWPIIGNLGVDLDVAEFPLYAKYSDNKLYLGIGMSFADDEVDEKSLVDSFATFKKYGFAKGLKKMSDKEFKLSQKSKSSGSLKHKWDTKIYGYAIFDPYGEGCTGNIMIEVEGKMEKCFSFSLASMPMVVGASNTAGVKVLLDTVIDPTKDDFSLLPKIDEIEATILKLRLYVGPGISKNIKCVVYGEGGIKGKSKPKTNYLGLYGSLECGISAKFFFLEADWPYMSDDNMLLYEQYFNKDIGDYLPGTKSTPDLAAQPEIKVANREYLEEMSEWQGMTNRARAAVTSNKITPLLTSTYENPSAKMIHTDDKTMMIWIGDKEDRADVDRFALYYSIYDKDAFAWSEPMLVEDNGTADFSPAIVTDGTDIYVAWSDMNQEFGDTADLDSMKQTEIKVAKYNAETGSFDDVYAITNNSAADVAPELKVSENELEVFWTECDTNAVLGAENGITSIKYTTINNTGVQGSVKTLKDKITGFVQLEVGNYGVYDYAYTLLQNTTTDDVQDKKLVLASVNGETKSVATGTIGVFGFNDVTEEEMFIYQEGNSLKCMTADGNVEILDEEFKGSEIAFFEKDNQTCLYYVESEEAESVIGYFEHTENGWENAGPIGTFNAENAYNLSNISGYYDGEKYHLTAVSDETVTTDEDEISITNVTSINDILCVDGADLSVEVDDFVLTEEGKKLTTALTISNDGAVAVEEATVNLKDSQGKTLASKQMEDVISSGNSINKELTLELKNPVTELGTYTIEVVPEDAEEIYDFNNSETFELGYSDYRMDTKVVQCDGLIRVTSMISNQGEVASGGAYVISNMDTQEILHEMILDEIPVGESAVLSFTLDSTTTDMNELNQSRFQFEFIPENENAVSTKNFGMLETFYADEVEKPSVDVTEVFNDVMEYDWFKDSVQYVYDKGMMSGSAGSFNPNGDMTRAMMVTTLYRMEGSPKVTDYTASSIFSDVEKGSWYEDAVNWAYNEGVTTGYPELKLFGSNDNVTREQLAVFLYRYANKQGLDVTKRGDVTSLKNHDKTSDYATEGISWAVGTGLISGIQLEENGVKVYDLAPQGSATRAQLATILMRFCEYYDL